MSETPGESFEVPDEFDRSRADKALSGHLTEWSRSRVQRLFQDGLVWRDDEVITKSTRVRSGELIQFSLPPNKPLELRPVAIPLDVIFEDDDLLVVNKPAGMVVHPGAGTGEDTLVHALLHHCEGRLSGIGGVDRPGIVHRLDKETSGLIVVAKSDRGFQGMSRCFLERRIEKKYLALVTGPMKSESGRIEAPIGRHPVRRTQMTVRSDGRTALSDWRLIESYPKGLSLVEVHIHTGRTHQIRVHLAHIGHPLAGDPTYGFRPKECPVSIPRVMLHAASLAFVHPVSSDPLHFEVPLPSDIAEVVRS